MSLAAALAACGGSQTVGTAPASYLPSSATETASTTSTTVYPQIGVAGVDDTLTLPVVSAAAPVTETISISAPSGVTPLSGLRAAAATVHTAAVTTTPVAYLEFTSTASVTVEGLPGVTFALTSITSGATYALALDTTEGYVSTGQTATVSGSNVTFAPAAGSFAITPTAPATFVLYTTTSTATASPSPSPTATASPTPTPAPSLSPASLVFDQTTPGLSQNITVTNAGTGAVAGVISCTASATPSPEPSASPTADPDEFVAEFANGTIASVTPTGGTAVFAITGGDELGTCTATFTPAGGTALTATIAVDAVSGGLYSVHRVKH